MGKLIIKTILLIFPLFILPALLDPYQVFHYSRVRDNGASHNENYIKMRYLLDNPVKFDAYLFGSSRVGGVNVENISGYRWYNMTYSAGLPHEHLENLAVMIEQGVIPRRVLIGIDDIACYTDPESHKHELLCLPFPVEPSYNAFTYIRFLVNYCNPIVLPSLRLMLFHRGDDQSFQRQFYENGSWQYPGYEPPGGECDWEHIPPVKLRTFTQVDRALADIQGIIGLCAAHDIPLILFTNPIHILTYSAAVKRGYIDFLEKLSDLTPFYNFSSINDVTANNDNYLETSHYRLNVGDLIIDRIFNDRVDEKLLSQGFGWQVTPENREAFISLLREQVSQGE